MKSHHEWSTRLAGSCPCFSENLHGIGITVEPECKLLNQCTRYDLWKLLQAKSPLDPTKEIPPLQIPFTTALMKSQLFTRSEIISSICSVFQVGVRRSTSIWGETLKNLNTKNMECVKGENNIRYIRPLS